MGIKRNTLYNLLGMLIPTMAAIVSAPILIKNLGIDRFGILTIAWLVVGYFSLFDFGLGRAVTKVVAEQIGLGRESDTPSTIVVALVLMLVLGVLGGVIVYVTSHAIVYNLLKIPENLKGETFVAFQLLAISIPFVVQTTAFRGVIEAYQRFGVSSVLNAGLGTFTYVGPLIAISFSRNLIAVAGILLVGRVVFWLLYLVSCEYISRFIRRKPVPQWRMIGTLFSFGGWIALSNLIGPLMVTFDRFFAGVLISTSVVAYYSTPLDAAAKMVIVAQAIAGVLFPVFATSLVESPEEVPGIFTGGIRWIFILLGPAVLFLVLFADVILRVWLGEEFAYNSTTILQLIALGVFLNGLAMIPFVLIQSAGRPKVTALINFGELPFYLILLYVLAVRFGLVGIAVAWLVRMAADVTLLLFFARPNLINGNAVITQVAKAILCAVVLILCALLFANPLAKLAYLAIATVLFLAVTWLLLMSDRERQMISHQMRSIVLR